MPNEKPSHGGSIPARPHPEKPMEREISAGVIIFRRTKEGPVFLILYNGGDYWNFPKGKLKGEERSFEAAVRETEEETGIGMKDLRFLRDFKAHERFVFRRDRKTISKTIIFYVAETRNPNVRLTQKIHGERHQGYGWFAYREATRILGKYRESQRVLKEAYEFLYRKGAPHRSSNSRGAYAHVPRGGHPGGKPASLPGSRQHS